MTCARSKLVVFAHFMASVICRWKSEECHLYVIKLLIVDIDIFRWGMLSLTWDAWRDAAAHIGGAAKLGVGGVGEMASSRTTIVVKISFRR